MSYLTVLLKRMGVTVEYAQQDVFKAERPELGRRAKADITWIPFKAFVSEPGRWGIQHGQAGYPRLMGNDITVHTETELKLGVLLRHQGDLFRITGNQRQRMGPMGQVWTYTCTTEAQKAVAA